MLPGSRVLAGYQPSLTGERPEESGGSSHASVSRTSATHIFKTKGGQDGTDLGQRLGTAGPPESLLNGLEEARGPGLVSGRDDVMAR